MTVAGAAGSEMLTVAARASSIGSAVVIRDADEGTSGSGGLGPDAALAARAGVAAVELNRQKDGLGAVMGSLSFLFEHIDWTDRPQE